MSANDPKRTSRQATAKVTICKGIAPCNESLGPTRIQKRGDGKKVSGNKFASSLLSICVLASERIFSSVSN
jgi:hypothetical protein